ncbi:hypothetical protein E2C01_072318 [Portunus trituberculatus]|uniref:Uncharacterized protein n=1 Tax=Portunus trituberculatus TaxID=210409 RepID=A0A5B7I7G0_PORTR|nr:hypothetical protein [Portunus trituberculatus]
MILECGGEVVSADDHRIERCVLRHTGVGVGRRSSDDVGVGGWSHSYPEGLHSRGDSHWEVRGAEGGSAINRHAPTSSLWS